jgi:hypothetical protein
MHEKRILFVLRWNYSEEEADAKCPLGPDLRMGQGLRRTTAHDDSTVNQGLKFLYQLTSRKRMSISGTEFMGVSTLGFKILISNA